MISMKLGNGTVIAASQRAKKILGLMRKLIESGTNRQMMIRHAPTHYGRRADTWHATAHAIVLLSGFRCGLVGRRF
jgi:hypothetical protein